VAENSAGRSEVTFKAWFNPASTSDDHEGPVDDSRRAVYVARDHSNNNDDDHEEVGSKTEVVIGVSVGAAVVLVGAVTVCVLFAVRRPCCHRKYAYYVRDNHVKPAPPPPTAPPPSASASSVVTAAWRRLTAGGRQLLRTASVSEESGRRDDADKDNDDDDDELICSTLKSLLEAKQLFDESLARHDEDRVGEKQADVDRSTD